MFNFYDLEINTVCLVQLIWRQWVSVCVGQTPYWANFPLYNNVSAWCRREKPDYWQMKVRNLGEVGIRSQNLQILKHQGIPLWTANCGASGHSVRRFLPKIVATVHVVLGGGASLQTITSNASIFIYMPHLWKCNMSIFLWVEYQSADNDHMCLFACQMFTPQDKRRQMNASWYNYNFLFLKRKIFLEHFG